MVSESVASRTSCRSSCRCMWAYSRTRGRLSQLFPPLAAPRPPQHHLLRSSLQPHAPFSPPPIHDRLTNSPSSSATTTSKGDASQDLSALFSNESANSTSGSGSRKKRSNSGVPSIPSGVRLDNISKSYKAVTVLKDVSWEVQHGEKVGLIGVNGAGNSTQLCIIAGLEDPNGENIVKAKENMKIVFLGQEFKVKSSWTTREEFLSAFQEEMGVKDYLDQVQDLPWRIGIHASAEEGQIRWSIGMRARGVQADGEAASSPRNCPCNFVAHVRRESHRTSSSSRSPPMPLPQPIPCTLLSDVLNERVDHPCTRICNWKFEIVGKLAYGHFLTSVEAKDFPTSHYIVEEQTMIFHLHIPIIAI